MKVKNKRRFAISLTLLILIALILVAAIGFGIFKGTQAIIKAVENKKTTEIETVVRDTHAEKGTIGANFDSSVLSVANFGLWGITTEDFAAQPMPEADKLETKVNLSYSVQDGSFEKQDANNSSGFSAAYFLRSARKRVSGKEAYYAMDENVMPNGYHFPAAIKEYVENNGVKVSMFTGSIDTLKSRLVKTNKPVIVLVGDALNWQHYMCFVGYDTLKTELYFADSSVDGDTNGEKPGNRTMQVSDFEQVWDNSMPVYNKFYIAAK